MIYNRHFTLFIWLLGSLFLSTTACESTVTTEPYTSKKYERIDCDKAPQVCKVVAAQIAAYAELIKFNRMADTTKVPDSIMVGKTKLSRAMLNKEMNTLRGYQFNLNEVAWIVGEAQKDKLSNIFTMFAINTDSVSIAHRKQDGSPITYLDLYFQVHTKGKSSIYYRPVQGLKLDDYGDFPRPCPKACPQ